MYVHLERGITLLAIDQETKITSLKSQPDNELKLIDINSQEEKGSDHVKKSIEDFKIAVELSSEKENELQLQDKIKPKLWLARAKLKNKQVEEAIADF